MRKGIVICGHGTKNKDGIASFAELFLDLKQHYEKEYFVNYGFIEYALPHFKDAILEQINQGITEILVQPALLFTGVHIEEDIPFAIQQIQKEHPETTIKLAPPIGLNKHIIELCSTIIEQEKFKSQKLNNDKHLLVIGVGSSKADANFKISELTHILWEKLQFKNASYAFISKMAFPSLDEELERLSKSYPEKIMTIPIILFPGMYLKRIQSKIKAFSEFYNGEIKECSHFNNNPLLTEGFIETIDNTIKNNINLLNQFKTIEKVGKNSSNNQL